MGIRHIVSRQFGKARAELLSCMGTRLFWRVAGCYSMEFVMKGIEIDNNMIIYSQFMVMGRVVVLY